ncbi:hypothetical protein O3M35_003029 [Rhynocoris fuscipes]|uniref:Threonine aspartase n=1 Tax=Rhynocoris fuscipes TaxID=488301 RepID=A0AAW1CL11_9HEMI
MVLVFIFLEIIFLFCFFQENRSSDDIIEENRLDTVGAVCADLKGNVAASCSSGGIALKQSGRVGQAAIFGAGCWAQRTGLNKGIATSVSGTGEDLIRTSLAKEVALAISKSDLQSNAVHDTIKSSFLESPFLTRNSEKLCGIIALEVSENSGEFIWAHTTNTMGISYMSTNHKHPKVKISKLPLGVPAGSTVAVEGVLW